MFVCVPTCMNVCPAASLADKNAAPHTQRRQSKATTSQSCHVRCDCSAQRGFVALRPLLRPFSSTHSALVSLSAQFVSHRAVSTCYCRPPARLLICLSVRQPASGLRRPASFIKRKQAGEITRDAGIWRQLICWQHRWGSLGASTENKPEIYIDWWCLAEQDSSAVVTGESQEGNLKKTYKTPPLFFAASLNCKLNTDGTRQTTFSLFKRGNRRAETGYDTVAIEENRIRIVLELSGRLQEKALTHGWQNPYHLTDQSSPAALLSAPSLVFNEMSPAKMPRHLINMSKRAGEFISPFFPFHQQEQEQNIWTFCTRCPRKSSSAAPCANISCALISVGRADVLAPTATFRIKHSCSS